MNMGLRKFQIILDGQDKPFSPGQIIAGRVILDVNRDKSIRGLKVRIKGTAEVKWVEFRGISSQMNVYTNDEEYFKNECYVLGGADNRENVEIKSGHHVFAFTFLLPHDIPSSFRQDHGSVKYTIEAIINGPWLFDYQTKMCFSVEHPFDLNEYSPAMNVIDDEIHEIFYRFPCIPMDSMNIHIYVPTSGYTVGELIKAKIDITNNSSTIDVTKVKLCLEQIIKVHARSRTKEFRNVVQKAEEPGPFDKMTIIMTGIQVPPVPQSNLICCKIIDIDYRLKFKIYVSDCHCTTKRSYPIAIGTKSVSFRQLHNAYINPEAIGNPSFYDSSFPLEAATSMIPFPTSGDPESLGISQNEIPCSVPYIPHSPSSPPTESFFAVPFSISGGQEFPGSLRNESNSSLQHSSNPYSFGIQPCVRQISNASTDPRFQYFPAIPPSIGFIFPNPSQLNTPIETTPPPSYEECMRMNDQK